MYSCNQLLQALEAGQCDAPLAAVYTTEGLTQARARALLTHIIYKEDI